MAVLQRTRPFNYAPVAILSRHLQELRTTIEHSETFTISVGLAMWEDDNTTSYEEILDRADKAVFKAKAEGRNRVVVDTTVV